MSTYFLMSAALILIVTAFHIAVARMGVRRTGLTGRSAVRLYAAAALLILALDLPLAYLFLIYKFYHPFVLDRVMHSVAAPFVVLHVNAALFSIFVLAHQSAAWRIRRKNRSVPPAPRLTPATIPLSLPAGRRTFLRNSVLAVATGAFATSRTLKAMAETKTYRIERVVIKLPRLPEALKGTTIAMIADIHSSVFMDREEMEVYKNAVMQLHADMIVVDGDFVNSKLFEVYPFAEAFAGMSATLGVWGVTGNHDHYTGDVESVAKEVEQCGIKLIRNANVPITKDGSTMWLLGVDDADLYDVKPYLLNGRTERGTIENMLKGIPNDAVKISLCHKPYPFEEYSQLGADLVLSGHTHGGQVVIAQMDNINVSFASLASRYVAGLYKGYTRPGSQLYVTRGVGTVGIPLRLNCAPEITHITLV